MVSSLVFMVLRYKVNWREQVKKAFERIRAKKMQIQLFKENILGDKSMINGNDSFGDKQDDDSNMYDNNIFNDEDMNRSQISYMYNSDDDINYEQDQEDVYESNRKPATILDT